MRDVLLQKCASSQEDVEMTEGISPDNLFETNEAVNKIPTQFESTNYL